jgi:hypothetical protein
MVAHSCGVPDATVGRRPASNQPRLGVAPHSAFGRCDPKPALALTTVLGATIPGSLEWGEPRIGMGGSPRETSAPARGTKESESAARLAGRSSRERRFAHK